LQTIPSGVGGDRRGYAERYAISFPSQKSLLITAWTASTRKEEITRFSKAVNNPDFSRMLRTRNLGPEHLEKQNRLRKQVRVRLCVILPFTPAHVPQSIRDRVEKLESHLQAAKNKLEREKSGKTGFK